ncbi:MAG: acetate kinase [Ornithinibacter sp.]
MSAGRVLVVNAGSSSLKYEVFDVAGGGSTGAGSVSGVGVGGRARHQHRGTGEPLDREIHCPTHAEAFAAAASALRSDEAGTAGDGDETLVAVGHRVVHGGARFTGPVLVDGEVLAALDELSPLAPLHNPANIEGIRRAGETFPGVPQVAVFDTAFHASIPPAAHTYAVPEEWRREHRVRRYGFHGTSYAYVSRRIAALLERDRDDVDAVILHLGNGASACAVQGGRSVDTSMGLTPVEGLVMGTRSGDVDPALGGYLERVAGVSPTEYDRALTRASGLVGLSGVSDFRDVSARRDAGDPSAALAFDVTVHRIVKYVGAYAAVLGRLDALVFTGGIGENSPALRAAVIDRLAILGIVLDTNANAHGPAERRVSTSTTRAQAWVVPTDEEAQIARAALDLLECPHDIR